jgi:hypothetical protein
MNENTEKKLRKAFPAADFESDDGSGVGLSFGLLRMYVNYKTVDGAYEVVVALDREGSGWPLFRTASGDLERGVRGALEWLLNWNSQICNACSNFHSVLCPDLYLDPADR